MLSSVGLRSPAASTRPHAHPHPRLVGRGVHEMQQRDVGAVEEDAPVDVGELHRLPLERDVDDAERGHGSAVGDRDLVARGQRARGARAARRDVDLAAPGAASTEEPTLDEPREEARERLPRATVYSRRTGDLMRRTGSLTTRPPARSRRCPRCRRRARPASARARACRSASLRSIPRRRRGASPCPRRRAARAPRRTGVQRLARARASRPRSTCDEAGLPTSTRSPTGSPVSGSYSDGGTRTRPPAVRAPRIWPSRRPARKRPSTGPTLRRYVYSRT